MHNDIHPHRIYSNSTHSHLYIKAHPTLRKWIAHYTFLKENMEIANPFLTLVPDAAGCITLRDCGQGLECVFWGATTQCVQVLSKQETLRFHFFIEFHPTAAFALLKHSQRLYLNEQIALYDVHPALDEHLKKAYEECTTLSSFVKTIDTLLLQLMEDHSDCVRFIRKQLQKGFHINETMEQAGYSRRHLQRMFLEQMGCTMKEYQRIERINQAVCHLQEGVDGTRAAQLCGYYDQSHFIHDFVQVCGMTPKKYVQKLSDFYNEPFKF